MEQGLTKNQILAELVRSPHSALDEYIGIGLAASKQDPEFMAHLIAWDGRNGQIRDAHIALPVVSLACPQFSDPEFLDNSLAHLAKLTPRELNTAYMFARGFVRNKDVVTKAHEKTGKPYKSRVGGWKRVHSGLLAQSRRMNTLDRLVSRYLKSRESNAAAFERNLIQFRRDMISLYALTHTAMSDRAKSIIIDKQYPEGSALAAIRDLERMSPREAAAAVVEHRIPFLSLFPILKAKAKDPVLLMAIIDRMTPSEIQTNMAMLERLGVSAHPETRAALALALTKTERSRKTVLKTSKAAENVQDQGLKKVLEQVQEKQISNAKGLEGNWLILADASGSMEAALETAKLVAGNLSRFGKSQVALVFFNTEPRYMDVTGKTLDEIRQATRGVTAVGGTSIGCGLLAAVERKFDVEGIVIVSDGEENRAPLFAAQYGALCKSLGREVPVYYYKVSGLGYDSLTATMAQYGLAMETRDLRNVRVDDYSISNLVQTMRVNRYSILDEVMETRLLTVDKVLGIEKEEFATCS